jgi:hypothetical protein
VEVLGRNQSVKRLVRVSSGKGIGVVSGRGSQEKDLREGRESGGGANFRSGSAATLRLHDSMVPEMRE